MPVIFASTRKYGQAPENCVAALRTSSTEPSRKVAPSGGPQ